MTDTNSLLDALAKPPPPPSELDELISRDPLELSAQDIDKIIAFQRAARARREAGGKTKKEYASQPGQSLEGVRLGFGQRAPLVENLRQAHAPQRNTRVLIAISGAAVNAFSQPGFWIHVNPHVPVARIAGRLAPDEMGFVARHKRAGHCFFRNEFQFPARAGIIPALQPNAGTKTSRQWRIKEIAGRAAQFHRIAAADGKLEVDSHTPVDAQRPFARDCDQPLRVTGSREVR